MKKNLKASEILKKHEKKKITYVDVEVVCVDCGGEKVGVYLPCDTCKGTGKTTRKMTEEQFNAYKQTKNGSARRVEKDNLS